jgi:hypothetical protein
LEQQLRSGQGYGQEQRDLDYTKETLRQKEKELRDKQRDLDNTQAELAIRTKDLDSVNDRLRVLQKR